MAPHLVRAQSAYKNKGYSHFITHTHTHTRPPPAAKQINGILDVRCL